MTLLADTIDTATDASLAQARVQDALERGGRIAAIEEANDAEGTAFVTVVLDGVRREYRVTAEFLYEALQN